MLYGKNDNMMMMMFWLRGMRGASLRGCGLFEFFHSPSMTSYECLLERILCMWNPEKSYFKVGAHVLTIEVEYIYFLSSLSRRGASVSLTGP